MKRIDVWAQSYAASPGGIQTFTRFVVQALRELYPEADICVFAKNDRSLANQEFDREAAVDNMRAACAPRKDAETRVLGFGAWPAGVRSVAFAVGVVWHAMRIPPRRDDVPTIIISTHVNFAPVAALMEKFVGHVPFCAIGHGIEVWKIPKASVRKALRAADQLVAVSEFSRLRMAKAIEVDPSRIEILPNTFDSEKFQPGPKSAALLQRYGLNADQPVILTVARLEATEQYKGYDQVLRALPAVLQRFPDVRYVIVGDGPDRGRVEALSKELRVEERVVFAGYVQNDELPAHYNLCDVFVMPSKGEGFGIVFLEALSCGKPVIAGDKDASVEAVLGGELGILVDPDSVEEITEAICRVLTTSRGQRTDVPPSPDYGVAGSDQPAGGGSKLSTLNVQLSTSKSEGGELQGSKRPTLNTQLSTLNSDERRRAVIEAYGFERFRARLGEIVEKLLVNG